ncbi:dehydrogenase [Lentinula edodes]|nr:dehydrogenase [Lentinula edodes]
MVSTHMKAVVKTGVGKVALKTTEIPKPGRGQVLVQIFAAAQNPSDWMKLKRDWPVDSVIAGHDFAGVIQQLGLDVPSESRQIGQRVAGFLNGCTSPENGGTFAEYCLADAMLLVDIPDDMSFESASTLGLAAFTACQVLWQSQKLPTPVDIAKDPFPILVWGGASAVGQFVIQLAKKSGLQVITTASPQNHELLRKLGADTVFDYRDPKVISNIKTFCGDKQLHVAIDCVSVDESVSLVTQCIEDCEDSYIALVLPVEVKTKYIRSDFTYVYTLLGKPIEGKYAYPAIPEHFEFGKWCAALLSRLAKNNTLSVTPIRVVPNGLADAQYWIDYQEEGKVRAQKIVYCTSSS